MSLEHSEVIDLHTGAKRVKEDALDGEGDLEARLFTDAEGTVRVRLIRPYSLDEHQAET